jgi:hypothetical protein
LGVGYSLEMERGFYPLFWCIWHHKPEIIGILGCKQPLKQAGLAFTTRSVLNAFLILRSRYASSVPGLCDGQQIIAGDRRHYRQRIVSTKKNPAGQVLRGFCLLVLINGGQLNQDSSFKIDRMKLTSPQAKGCRKANVARVP